MSSFRTEITPDNPGWTIHYDNQLLMMGSCFAENVGNELKTRLFQVDLNPFGVLFNPVSIAGGMQRLIQNNPYETDDLFFRDGLWHSFDHHSRFSGTDPNEVLQNINLRLKGSAHVLSQATVFFITFGTARVYHHIQSGRVVANCHKLPAAEFNTSLLRVGDIVKLYTRIIQDILQVNPTIQIVLTVSPVRHWKDGANGNQLSKATLLLAVSELVKNIVNVSYFPAYEMFMDDLRDYRFYAEDLIHPGSSGIAYIWEKFCACYFSEEAQTIMKRVEKIQKDRAHIPLNPESDTYRLFQEQVNKKMHALQSDFPQLNFSFD